jgi:hypothetical protein
MSLVFIGVSFMSLLTATTLAIDVGMFMTSRSQAQNAADAGALSGAIALAYDSFTDRSPAGPAVQSAITTAMGNRVGGEAPSVEPEDVTFHPGTGGVVNRVQVIVHRTTERENPIPTLMGALFGVQTVNITATATAEAAPADSATCVKPFTIPDRWTERQTPPWDPDDDTFTIYDRNRRTPLANPDIYIPATQSGYTGYHNYNDRGLRLEIRAANGTNVSPSMYHSWKMPGAGENEIGADFYEWNIRECNPNLIPIGTVMQPEPGAMSGPTVSGMELLMAKDPGAYWDDGCRCVKGSAFPRSPRVATLPVYDPVFYEEGIQNGRNADLKIANYIGFFIESIQGGRVFGRIAPTGGIVSGNGPVPGGAFLTAIRLVQ